MYGFGCGDVLLCVQPIYNNSPKGMFNYIHTIKTKRKNPTDCMKDIHLNHPIVAAVTASSENRDK